MFQRPHFFAVRLTEFALEETRECFAVFISEGRAVSQRIVA
jgi:hypothetical protein